MTWTAVERGPGGNDRAYDATFATPPLILTKTCLVVALVQCPAKRVLVPGGAVDPARIHLHACARGGGRVEARCVGDSGDVGTSPVSRSCTAAVAATLAPPPPPHRAPAAPPAASSSVAAKSRYGKVPSAPRCHIILLAGDELAATGERRFLRVWSSGGAGAGGEGFTLANKQRACNKWQRWPRWRYQL